MNEFLLQYYMQKRFNNMPPEVYAKFEDYLKGNNGKGDFRGHMKEWKQGLMHEQPAGSNKFVENDLPDPTQDRWNLSDDEWKKLFKAFRNAFRSMAHARDDDHDPDFANTEDNKEINNFLNKHFGDAGSHLFSHAVADPTIEPMLDNLADILKANPDLEYLISGYLGDVSYSDFVSGVKKKKYNKDSKFQDVLKKVVGYLHYMKQQQASGWGSEEFQQFAPSFASLDLKVIKDGLADNIPDAKLEEFKSNYSEFLDWAAKKKVNAVFKKHDGGKITGQIDAAKEKVDYDNKESKDYVPPKRDDELTPLQQMRRHASNAWNDVLGKYFSFHGNRVYFSPAAREIVQAIDGAKIKPTDGIDKILSSAGDIKKKLQYKSPTATDHFDWFIKTLTELKDTMPKAFAGALKNGGQMRAIIGEVIMKAVHDNKIKEARTAMEVLSVIKYGYTTSKIMDAMRKEELKIFSDGGLTWNKNQGMQFVSTALDRSIKAAFLSVGYSITMVGNAIRLNGSKFNGHLGKRLEGVQNRWQTENDAAKQAADAARNRNNATDVNMRAPYEQTLRRLNRSVNDANLAARESEVETRDRRAQQRHARLERARARPQYVAADDKVKKVDTLNGDLETLASELDTLRNDAAQLRSDIAALDAKINNPATYAGMPAAAANAHAAILVQEKHAKEQELAAKTTEIANKTGAMFGKSTEYRTETGQVWTRGIAMSPTGHGAQYVASKAVLDRQAQAEQAYLNYVDKTDQKKEKIAQFKEARDNLREINDRIDKRNSTMDEWDDKHKDQYKELMAYWDMLESGRDSHTGKMYKWDLLRSNKHAQSVFDQKKEDIINSNLANYQYAA